MSAWGKTASVVRNGQAQFEAVILHVQIDIACLAMLDRVLNRLLDDVIELSASLPAHFKRAMVAEHPAVDSVRLIRRGGETFQHADHFISVNGQGVQAACDVPRLTDGVSQELADPACKRLKRRADCSQFHVKESALEGNAHQQWSQTVMQLFRKMLSLEFESLGDFTLRSDLVL
jgi:hypothetical protein